MFAILVTLMQFQDPLGDASVWQATQFWSLRLTGFAVSLLAGEWLVARLLVGRLENPPWLKPAVIMILVAAVPMTVVDVSLEGIYPTAEEFDDSAVREQSLLLAGVLEYLTIITVLLPLNAVLWVAIHARARPVDMEAAGDPVQPEFLNKAEGLTLGQVIALQAEEHYVRVHAVDRNVLIYGRFSDAVSEMPKALGLRVHRSWWVADNAVAQARRGERRYRLELVNGTSVPVSDRYLPDARRRGLLAKRS